MRIEHDALAEYFQADHDERSHAPVVLAELRRRLAEQPPVPHSPDCLERVRAFRDEAAARIASW